ncbi:MAG TPA: 2-phospho-L-lactate guanylyltransferase [Sphingobium sp.]|nr:2-phospho-L-lactate guanylyltransferase [Sphingobium sp.]
MLCWVVIPVKAPEACKTRLSPALGDDERQALVAAMLRQTLAAARAVVARERVMLLGPSRHGLDEDIALLPDPGRGLNVALTSARDAALRAGIDRLLLLSGDLPTIAPDDVAALLEVPADAVAAGPDRAGLGTNALSLPLPAAAEFRFRYGEGSLAKHKEEAERMGLSFLTIDRPGLGLDIDRPDEIGLWRRG